MKNLLRYGLLFCCASLLHSIEPTRLQAQTQKTPVNSTSISHNQNSLLPLKRLDQHRIAVVTPLPHKYSAFTQTLQRYAEVETFDFNQYDENTKYFNTIIVAGTASDLRPDLMAMLQQTKSKYKQLILCVFDATAPSAHSFEPANTAKLSSPLSDRAAQQQMAMSIFGGMAVTKGKIKTSQTRLQYSDGAAATNTALDLNSMTAKIDAIAAEAIREQATPGMVVMAVKDGNVIFEKSYGHHTYQRQQPTQIGDIFDLASISKIAGTTPVIMHLQEKGALDLQQSIGHYLYQAQQSDKADITVRSVLLHEAGFTPFIPFYRNLNAGDLIRQRDAQHQVQVADSAYLLNNYYSEVMWPMMLRSAVKPVGKYVYSDISMYVMKEIAEHQTGVPMDTYVHDFLYKPIGMKTAGYNPRERFEKNHIVPTEEDSSFRKILLQGFVHDQGAAMAGGVAGHAGLFGSANDLAIFGQLLLNKGQYGGARYFNAATVDLFTSTQSATSRRGLGFDRVDPDPAKEYPSRFANSSVYGHTGYTGTCIWIDPQNQLVYIFLSNRVHPQVSTKLLNLNIRSRIQDAIYETINAGK